MTKGELIQKLTKLQKKSDPEIDHCEADKLLLEFINDDEITSAYNGVTKWYA